MDVNLSKKISTKNKKSVQKINSHFCIKLALLIKRFGIKILLEIKVNYISSDLLRQKMAAS